LLFTTVVKLQAISPSESSSSPTFSVLVAITQLRNLLPYIGARDALERQYVLQAPSSNRPSTSLLVVLVLANDLTPARSFDGSGTSQFTFGRPAAIDRTNDE
jgi:hypothetical protein